MSEARRILSLLTSEGELKIMLADMAMPEPGDDDVVIAVEAAPINPSDLAVLVGPANLDQAHNAEDGTLVAPVDPRILKAFKSRIDKPLPCGNEGAGTVVAAGKSAAAQSLMGKRVSCLRGNLYATHAKVPAAICMELPDPITAQEGASSFVNPLTALSMVDTMRLDGHKALIHTTAASNLGQMLNRICRDESVPLINIVRTDEQAALLKSQGADCVVNSSADDFMPSLTDAIADTNASLCFDAIGGGKLADRVLNAMERAFSRNAEFWSPYGSTIMKQVYIYGGLDLSPTVLNRGYGMAWQVGGYLLNHFMQRVGPERMQALQARVVDEIHTTFKSSYSETLTLEEMLKLDTVRAYNAKATGQKFLVVS